MTTIGRIQNNGDLLLAGSITERLPVVRNGLTSHYPFDGTLNHFKSIKGAKVLGTFNGNGGQNWLGWFKTNAASFTEIDFLRNVTLEQAKQYDLIVIDCYAWAVQPTDVVILKTFVDAGVSCLAVGNDTRTNVFVKTYTNGAGVLHDVIVDEESPVEWNGPGIIITNSDSDLYGGIAELQGGATPLYRRADSNLITGYLYESPESGAALYFSMEAVAPIAAPFIQKTIEYILDTSNAAIKNTNTTMTYEGLACDEYNVNFIKNGCFQDGLGVQNEAGSAGNNSIIEHDDNPMNHISTYVLRQDAGADTEYQVQIATGLSLQPNTAYRLLLWVYHSPDFDGNFQVMHARAWSASGLNVATTGEGNLLEVWGEWERRYIDITTPSDYSGTFQWYIGYPTQGTKGYRLVTGIQMTDKPFNPEWTDTGKNSGLVELPVSINSATQSFTVSFDIAPNGDNIADSNSYVMLNNFGKLWQYSPTGGDVANRRYIWDYVMVQGAARHHTDLIHTTAYTPCEYETMTITWDTNGVSFYRNGKLWTSKPKHAVDCVLGVIDKIVINKLNAKVRNLSVYNRVLTTAEIDKLSRPKFSILQDGQLLVDQFIENTNLGNGKDGGLLVSSPNTVVNHYAYITADLVKGSYTIPVDSISGFNTEDEVMILQMQDGTGIGNAGKHEFGRIKSVSSNSITLYNKVKRDYGSGVPDTINASSVSQIVRIPNYTSVSISEGASITCPAWDGKKGGVVVFRSQEDVFNSGEIHANEKGYRGGRSSGIYGYTDANGHGDGECGEGYKGRGRSGFYTGETPVVVDGGGITYVGGGGGSYGTKGQDSSAYSGIIGPAGFTYGDNLMDPQLFFGSGGGAGHGNSGFPMGGHGGGIIAIYALSIDGVINAKGQTGWNYNNDPGVWSGGGGSGGSVYIETHRFQAIVDVSGGLKGSTDPALGTRPDGQGGNGGQGVFRVWQRKGIEQQVRIKDIVQIQGAIREGQSF